MRHPLVSGILARVIDHLSEAKRPSWRPACAGHSWSHLMCSKRQLANLVRRFRDDRIEPVTGVRNNASSSCRLADHHDRIVAATPQEQSRK